FDHARLEILEIDQVEAAVEQRIEQSAGVRVGLAFGDFASACEPETVSADSRDIPRDPAERTVMTTAANLELSGRAALGETGDFAFGEGDVAGVNQSGEGFADEAFRCAAEESLECGVGAAKMRVGACDAQEVLASLKTVGFSNAGWHGRIAAGG